MPRPPALVAVIALTAAVAAAPVPKDRVKPFFPTAKGTRWVYEIRDLDRPNGPTSREEKVITAVERKDGATLVTIGFVAAPGEQQTPAERLRVTADGVYLLEKDGDAWEPPLCYLQLPPRPDDKWATDLDHGGTRWKGVSTTSQPEEVEVPAGKFTAVRVELVATIGGEPYQITNWYAEGVGRVKRLSVSKNWKTEQVLTKFTLGTE